MIREAILTAFCVYLVVTLLQIINVTAVAIEGIVFLGAIVGVAALYWSHREMLVERVEIITLWVSVLLFAAYGCARLGGWI